MVTPGGALSGREAGWLSGLGTSVRRRWADWAQRGRDRAMARALYSLSDGELRDMGLSRGDISAVASGTYRRTERQSPSLSEGLAFPSLARRT